MDKIRLGISTCLLGEKVRHDGGHKHDPWLTGTLGKYVEYVPVCPEVEMGLTIPREAMRQVGDPEQPRLVTIRSGIDHTERMREWARRRVAQLEGEGLCGFIFKSKSPSSGMARVKVYDARGVPHHSGVGIFARVFMEHFPLLPVEEDGRLHDPSLRENFIESIFVFQRWRNLLADPSRGALVDFHARHKLLLLGHSPELYRLLGKRTASLADESLPDVLAEYQQLLMRAMRLRPTVSKHINVLQHLLGYFKRQLNADEKCEVLELIEEYHRGNLPLIVPVTLINHFVRKYDQPYLKRQHYLHPHPLELQLRNHV
jgi:uncharacterized protein YbgA (DUF1722 family)/uncharacterized protein YbbK (DUF523 family)